MLLVGGPWSLQQRLCTSHRWSFMSVHHERTALDRCVLDHTRPESTQILNAIRVFFTVLWFGATQRFCGAGCLLLPRLIIVGHWIEVYSKSDSITSHLGFEAVSIARGLLSESGDPRTFRIPVATTLRSEYLIAVGLAVRRVFSMWQRACQA